MTRRRTVFLAAVLLVALVVAAGAGWWLQPLGPEPEALAPLESDATVTVETEPWLVFRPAGAEPTTGLVLYPGARVDPRSYAPAARALAERGHLVVITPMPLNMAVLAPDRAAEVLAAFPAIDHWSIGGHSLGGAMAARFAHKHPELVDGLVLWAAYPAETDDLAEADLVVASVYGTRDGIATLDDIERSRPLLPADTHWFAIEGGNHAGFGYYGEQDGDLPAEIPREEQQRSLVEATDTLLRATADLEPAAGAGG